MTFLTSVRRRGYAYLFLLPSLAVVALISLYPLAFGIYMAFTDISTRRGTWYRWHLVGLKNFERLASELLSWRYGLGRALLNTIVFTVINVGLQVLTGLAAALFLNMEVLPAKRLFRSLFIVPWAVPGYVSIMAWFFLYNYSYGYLNQILLNLGFDRVDWLGMASSNTFWPWVSIHVTNTWLAYPFMMSVILAALQSVPKELIDAARVDGASGPQIFRLVILPHIRPPLVFATILTTITTFQQFGVVWILTGGGPLLKEEWGGHIVTIYATDTLMTYGYRMIFQLGEYGLAAAYSLLLIAIVVPVSLAVMKRFGGVE